MLWFKAYVVGIIISFQENLFYTLIMKLSSMSTLKTSLTIVMGNESLSFKNTHLLLTGVENKAVDSLSRAVYIISSMAIQVVDFDILKRDYNFCKD